jgi:hypothetical protein
VITKRTSSKTLHKWHKEMWIWLSENPDKCKFDWPKWDEVDSAKVVRDNCYCFACFELEITGMKNCKQYCPINWTEGNEDITSCVSYGSLYNDLYSDSVSDEERSERCLKIANLPWSYKRKEKE